MEKENLVADADMAESTTVGDDEKTLAPMDYATDGVSSGLNTDSVSKKPIGPCEVGDDYRAPCIYRQDVVRYKKDGERIGFVTEIAGDPDSDSDITYDDDDDDSDESDDDEGNGASADDNSGHDGEDADDGKVNEDSERKKDNDQRKNPLPADQVRVMWMDHSETTHSLRDVTVIDRSFLHGDFVAAASDRTGQVGVVLDINISVDLLAADGSAIKDVSSRELKRVSDFTVGDYVVLGPWIGRVDEVVDDVTVLFDDGSMCKVTKADPLRLKSVSKSIMEDEHFPYYPGQRVRATSSSIFKNARWLSGLWKASRLEGTVSKVTVGSVFIYWIASAGCGSGCSAAPAEEQSPKNLKLLSCLAHANWQLGDRCFIASPPLSPATPSDKNTLKVKSEDSVRVGAVSGELENGLEGVLLEKADQTGTSVPSIESMDLDTVPNLDLHTDNLEDNTSQESSSCRSSKSVSKESLHENWTIHRKKMRKVVVRNKKGRKKEENFERALLIVNTKTRVDVVWQDGKRERGLVSTTLIPIDNPGDQEFVPEQYVVEKASDDNDDASEVQHVGVVRSVNAKERTACVRWLKPVARPEDPREFDKEEMVSVYGLDRHPDYDYCHGDVVVRLSPVSVSSSRDDFKNQSEESELASMNADKCDPKTDYSNQVEDTSTDENHADDFKNQSEESELPSMKADKCDPKTDYSNQVEDASTDENHADFSDLSWVGNITGLKDGDIEVTWADGMVSTVGPQAIYVVGRDDDESIGVGSEISDAASWETVNEDAMDTFDDNVEEEAGVQDANSIAPEAETAEDDNSGGSGPLSILLAAHGFVTRLTSGLFSRGRKQIDPSYKACQSPGIVDALESRASSTQLSPLSYAGENTEDDGHVSETMNTTIEIETLSSLRSDEADARKMVYPCSFKRFDTAKDPLDHFFLSAYGQNNSGRKWLKKVQQDWSILQKNLPDSIYVRVYEDRMDLLRAVIVGAYGTPYQDGLFVFDFHLPPEYPDVPPSAHYHSGGWRINPNLYEEGKVCLSLLNTWTGRGNEVWDPSSSSILQVLVSLQGLVLNSKPYFNEAGYDKQVGTAEGEKNSLSYNENTFLLNCKSMMYLLRKSPKDFEELVKDHFRRRGHYILKACDAYMKGFSIGSLTEDASLSDKSNETSTSVGFKLMLAKIIPKLIAALNDVGADVHQFKHLEQL